MERIQLSIEEKDLAYLKRLVESGEAASVSHAVRRIIREYRKLKRSVRVKPEGR